MVPAVEAVIHDVTVKYLDQLNMGALPTPAELKAKLFEQTHNAIELQNAALPKTYKLKQPTGLTPYQIYLVISKLYHVRRVSCAGNNSDHDLDLLTVYQEDGPDKGIYVDSEIALRRIIRQFNDNMTFTDIRNVMDMLQENVPHVARTVEPNLIPVNNGVFDYATKQLLPFSPDYVFLSKSRVDYDPTATSPVIRTPDGDDWDVESWIAELSDDPEVVSLIWEILGAIIRPFVPWNKSAWFYSESGNNGKGSLCELMRNLCGQESYAAIPLADFGKDFMLEPLVRSNSIIVDENDVGIFIDRAANLKAVVTGDTIQINRKFKSPFAFQFKGFMVQCLNEFPRIKDRSDSFYRRQLFVPFDKCFTGAERKYIKHDYLKRQDVLRYVLRRVLESDYDTLSEPDACLEVLNAYKEFNDPVRQFVVDVLPECKWDLLPFPFLYDLYKAWYQANSPSGKPQARNTFLHDLDVVLQSMPNCGWYNPGARVRVRASNKITCAEPMIIQYNLTDWMNPRYRGPSPDQRAMPDLKPMYSGLLRDKTAVSDDGEEEDIDQPFPPTLPDATGDSE